MHKKFLNNLVGVSILISCVLGMGDNGNKGASIDNFSKTFSACISAAGNILMSFTVFTEHIPSRRKLTNLPSNRIYKTS